MTPDDPDDARRKDKVLHTRVPEVLERELKNLAKALRVPVSNVVRTILEDAVDAVDAVGTAAEGELRDVAERLRRARGRAREGVGVGPSPVVAEPDAAPTPSVAPEPPLAGVVGFQPLWLARASACAVCGQPLDAGKQAFLGVREAPGRPAPVVCATCLPFDASRLPGSVPGVDDLEVDHEPD